MAKQKKKNYTHAMGRRKSASARVRLYKGSEESTVNDILIGKYFPGESMRVFWRRPFELTDSGAKYYVTARVVGGGKMAQLGAVTVAVARALAVASPEKYRPILRKVGLLTVDGRTRERRKVGMGGKARRKRQSPKR